VIVVDLWNGPMLLDRKGYRGLGTGTGPDPTRTDATDRERRAILEEFFGHLRP
jgi:hypothetical protein